MITIIAAASENNVIGNKGEIPWHLPNDFKMFKEVTSGHPIIMGRKTLDSLPGILPNRHHFVISRRNYVTKPEDVTFIKSHGDALDATRGEDVFIIGGGQVYAYAMQYADRILLTRVFTTCEGDTFFPHDLSGWRLIKYEYHEKDEKHKFDYAFMEYIKINIL